MSNWRTRAFAIVLAVLTAAPLTGGAAELQLGRFVDDDQSVHEADIEALAESGITRGCNPPDNDEYCPEDAVTRAQMASFLVRALELPAGPSGQFGDLGDSVHTADIEALGASGITRGCNPPDNDEYCPDQPVTRAQMASFLVRALDLPEAPGGQFTDVSESVHQPDIEALGASGITRGCNPPDNDRYCPDQPVTRAQMASFLVRALEMDQVEPEPSVNGTLEVRFLDIGYGDAALYIGECGEVGLIDAAINKGSAILDELNELGVTRLEWIVATHYDNDAFGDVEEIGRSGQIEIGTVYDRGGGEDAMPDSNKIYPEYYDWVTTSGKRQPVEIGDQITLCEGTERVEFNVLSVGIDGVAAGGTEVFDENDKGICLKVEFGNFDLASCADIHGNDDRPTGDDVDLESVVAPMIGDVEATKINKHGAADSSNQFWINTLSAQVAVLTASSDQRYPDGEVMARWNDASTVYTTNGKDESPLDGTVVIVTEGIDSFTVETTVSGKSDSYSLDETG